MLLACMMALVPALGVPSQELLQDTLKSGIVVLMTLCIALLFLWQTRKKPRALAWHPVLYLPIGLALYAAGSMAWSHTYLGGVEMIRWSIFSLLLWLGTTTWEDASETTLFWGIHWGVTIASVWTAWQFWGDLQLFPQGPNPASTFVNRNFFAEFAICALPYSIYLLLQSRRMSIGLLLAINVGFNVCALMMTGTRSAFIALALLVLLLPVFLIRFRDYWPALKLGWAKCLLILVVIVGAAASLGSIPTGNARILSELGRISPNERAFDRGASMASRQEYSSGSFSIRTSMWAATLRMARAHPWLGVGAGAWEVEIPLYQNNARLTETDYYAHNEPLQLIAEYGVLGWFFLAILMLYLAYALWLTWQKNDDAASKSTLRVTALCSLLMLLVVCNAGFPWRTAGTGALFALGLSVLAASDRRAAFAQAWLPLTRPLAPSSTRMVLIALAACLAIAIYVSTITVRVEKSLVQSLQLSMMVGESGDPQNPRWSPLKSQALQQVKEGIALNPHYRKITPAIGDQFAQWGDLKTAIWIWESVLASRPNVLALLCNLSRAYLDLGNLAAANDYLVRAQRLQPDAPEVRILEIEQYLRAGQTSKAESRFAQFMQDDAVDYRMAMLTYKAAKQAQYTPLMITALRWRIKHIASERDLAWLTLGKTLASTKGTEAEALQAFRQALNTAANRAKQQAILEQIPDLYRSQLKASEITP